MLAEVLEPANDRQALACQNITRRHTEVRSYSRTCAVASSSSPPCENANSAIYTQTNRDRRKTIADLLRPGLVRAIALIWNFGCMCALSVERQWRQRGVQNEYREQSIGHHNSGRRNGFLLRPSVGSSVAWSDGYDKSGC